MFKEFVVSYLLPALSTILVGIISYIGIYIKRDINNYLINKTKVVDASRVYHAVLEMYPDISRDEIIDRVSTSLEDLFNEKGIKVTSLELNMLVYGAINGGRDIL